MKTKQIPLITMLLAGAVISISTKLMHYELETALWILLAVLIVFYVIGCLIKRTIDSFEAAVAAEGQPEEGSEEVSEEGEEIEGESSEDTQQEQQEQTEPEDVEM